MSHPELEIRWAKIQQSLEENNVEAALIVGSTNLIYAVGRVVCGYFYIPRRGEPRLFVRRPAGMEESYVTYVRKPEELASQIDTPKSIALELDEISYGEIQRLFALFPNARIENASTMMRSIRSVKTPFEIMMHRRSAERHSECIARIPSLYRAGMTDLALSIEVERLFRRNGSLGYFRGFGRSMEIFMGSLLAGDNADAPSPYDFSLGGAGIDPSLPIGCTGHIMKTGEAVMVDMGGCFSAYMTDMTRTFSIGSLPSLAYDAHALSIEIQDELVRRSGIGVSCAELYHRAIELVEKAGLSSYFMGYTQQAAFVGHGVGLEINELPVLHGRSRETLDVGQIIALEPKFVIPKVGAVGTENTYVMTSDGLDKITLYNEEIIDLLC